MLNLGCILLERGDWRLEFRGACKTITKKYVGRTLQENLWEDDFVEVNSPQSFENIEYYARYKTLQLDNTLGIMWGDINSIE